jgi:hypothetical protein
MIGAISRRGRTGVLVGCLFGLGAEDAMAVDRPTAAATAVTPFTAITPVTTVSPGRWARNDPARPQPPERVPGGAVLGLAPPPDAIVLFDGRSLEAWVIPPGSGWAIRDGVLVPGGLIDNHLETRQRFGSLQLHLEFRTPFPAAGEGQHRGNSGVFLLGVYEIQIVDSFRNPTYADGLPGAIYGQVPPSVVAVRPPGEWQSLDIVFDAPRFDHERLVSPPFVTVLLNGIVVQNHQQILGDTKFDPPAYRTRANEGPIGLQDHGAMTDLVGFRNIWVRPIATADDAR